MGSEFDANYTRLKTILILFLLIFFIYTCEVMILGTGNENLDDITKVGEMYDTPEITIWSGLGAIVDGIVAIFTFLFQIITFTLPTVPFWMTVIMAPIMTVLLIIVIYLVIDTIYAIVKALPLT